MICRFMIPLRPKAKERPRHRGSAAYTPKATKDYERDVRYYYERECGKPPTDKPVMVTMTFNFSIPASARKADKARMLMGTCPYTARPDLDNIEKAVMDALNGVAFKDDCQVVAKISLKRFWRGNSVMIQIDEMEEIDYEHGVFAGYGQAEPDSGCVQ